MVDRIDIEGRYTINRPITLHALVSEDACSAALEWWVETYKDGDYISSMDSSHWPKLEEKLQYNLDWLEWLVEYSFMEERSPVYMAGQKFYDTNHGSVYILVRGDKARSMYYIVPIHSNKGNLAPFSVSLAARVRSDKKEGISRDQLMKLDGFTHALKPIKVRHINFTYEEK